MIKKMKSELPKKAAKPSFMEDEEIEMELEAPESEEMVSEEVESEAPPSPFADAADEDLLAELEARGMDVSALRAQLESASPEMDAEAELELDEEME